MAAAWIRARLGLVGVAEINEVIARSADLYQKILACMEAGNQIEVVLRDQVRKISETNAARFREIDSALQKLGIRAEANRTRIVEIFGTLDDIHEDAQGLFGRLDDLDGELDSVVAASGAWEFKRGAGGLYHDTALVKAAKGDVPSGNDNRGREDSS